MLRSCSLWKEEGVYEPHINATTSTEHQYYAVKLSSQIFAVFVNPSAGT
jgi:hypothetical protein